MSVRVASCLFAFLALSDCTRPDVAVEDIPMTPVVEAAGAPEDPYAACERYEPLGLMPFHALHYRGYVTHFDVEASDSDAGAIIRGVVHIADGGFNDGSGGDRGAVCPRTLREIFGSWPTREYEDVTNLRLLPADFCFETPFAGLRSFYYDWAIQEAAILAIDGDCRDLDCPGQTRAVERVTGLEGEAAWIEAERLLLNGPFTTFHLGDDDLATLSVDEDARDALRVVHPAHNFEPLNYIIAPTLLVNEEYERVNYYAAIVRDSRRHAAWFSERYAHVESIRFSELHDPHVVEDLYARNLSTLGTILNEHLEVAELIAQLEDRTGIEGESRAFWTKWLLEITMDDWWNLGIDSSFPLPIFQTVIMEPEAAFTAAQLVTGLTFDSYAEAAAWLDENVDTATAPFDLEGYRDLFQANKCIGLFPWGHLNSRPMLRPPRDKDGNLIVEAPLPDKPCVPVESELLRSQHERCHDGIDNNGDCIIDCDDPWCVEISSGCRAEEEPNERE